MADMQVFSTETNNIMNSETSSLSSYLSSYCSNPFPFTNGKESLRLAEQRAHEIIYMTQPTVVSDQMRKAIAGYVQRLIKSVVTCEVFPFGSVPLKTYLPNGDIDLTAFSSQIFEENLTDDVRSILEKEERNNAAEFEVKDIQYIQAEVKLIKCVVQNIVVDISFNQLGGLCTLCFLEKVDRVIGRDHLFKRSIILIKAWCYYESRILGAHHGLISTYALETLVLYIFHLFHSSLQGPLTVLYRFLDYFSKFDWENYFVSLNGPVAVSSLPQIVAETPETDGAELLLTKDFFQGSLDMFSAPLRAHENNSLPLQQKHLNIIDPLKVNNNLGRSVSKGNFYRIRNAFSYGARNLGKILALPAESIVDEVDQFFMNTLERHRRGQRPDVQDPSPRGIMLFDTKGSGSMPLTIDVENSTEANTILASPSIGSNGQIGETMGDGDGVLSEIINMKILGSEWKHGTEMQTGGQSSNHLPTGDEPQENVVSSIRMAGDAKHLATNIVSCSKITNDTHHGAGNQTKFNPDGLLENKLSFRLQVANEEIGFVLRADREESESTSNDTFLSHIGSFRNSDIGFRERDSPDAARSSEMLNGLLDLSGDSDSNFKNQLYAQYCLECIASGPILPNPPPPPPPPPSQFHNEPSSDGPPQPGLLKMNIFSHRSAIGVVQGSQFPPQYHPLDPQLISGAYDAEEIQKPRGTGTYIPNTNHRSYRERHFPDTGRQWVPGFRGHFSRHRYNGTTLTRSDAVPEKGNHDPPVFSENGHWKPGPLEFVHIGPVPRGPPHSGFTIPLERLEFGSFRQRQLGLPTLEQGAQPYLSALQQTQVSIPTLPIPSMPRPPGLNAIQERVPPSYHLNYEGDFPPLSALSSVRKDR
ncbi:uncharacterized protein LOC143856609 [Tasmannia lanceolata]|uniref:uncharacterized protein LOC143856609 n=1 Tax=Tasmannia lanceolata TaxID=3420 RepID=UPI004063D9DF